MRPDRTEALLSAIFFVLASIASALGAPFDELFNKASETESVRPRQFSEKEKREIAEIKRERTMRSVYEEINASTGR